MCEVSQDAAVQHFVQVPTPYKVEHAAFFVEQTAIVGWASGQRAEFLAAAATGVRLGRVGLGLGQGGAAFAEIGYWVDPAARQHGVATHAVMTLCRWALAALDLGLIEWRTEVGNIASRRVAEKAGFVIEATLRQRQIHRGARVDVWVGSLLKDECVTELK